MKFTKPNPFRERGVSQFPASFPAFSDEQIESGGGIPKSESREALRSYFYLQTTFGFLRQQLQQVEVHCIEFYQQLHLACWVLAALEKLLCWISLLVIYWRSILIQSQYDDNCAFKETARQLCMEHHLLFSKMASFDENSQFIIAMLRECGLAHNTIIFARILNPFNLLFGKQRLLYSLLDAMQSVTSQAVVIGISSRLDTDQLLEKRVRSRFSHRKILFLPPSKEEVDSLLQHLLSLPADSSFPSGYVSEFSEKIKNITSDTRFKDMLSTFLNVNSTVNSLLKFMRSLDIRFRALEAVRADCSILELYLLVCMRRVEVKEQSSYNFICVMKEYKTIHDSFQTSDYYTQNVCLRAFEHLREREVICYAENRGQSQTGEYRPMKLLISAPELHQGMRSHACCPVSLHFCIYAFFYFCKLISNLVISSSFFLLKQAILLK
ncbi:BnaA02g27150D [Brassica napus]|uniref:BnaA02g27150D protein n=1 Tax=Brassica napus TaxID=3708 RepID=A0A078HRR8_BRANA|nr:BnaA02g27150D [Brassica napus]